MSTGSVEVVYRGIFQKTLAKNICRGIVFAANKEGKIGLAFGRYGDSPERNGIPAKQFAVVSDTDEELQEYLARYEPDNNDVTIATDDTLCKGVESWAWYGLQPINKLLREGGTLLVSSTRPVADLVGDIHRKGKPYQLAIVTGTASFSGLWVYKDDHSDVRFLGALAKVAPHIVGIDAILATISEQWKDDLKVASAKKSYELVESSPVAADEGNDEVPYEFELPGYTKMEEGIVIRGMPGELEVPGRDGGYVPARNPTFKKFSTRTMRPVVNFDTCTQCKICWLQCPDTCFDITPDGYYEANMESCCGCGVCEAVCPVENCITMVNERAFKDNASQWEMWSKDKDGYAAWLSEKITNQPARSHGFHHVGQYAEEIANEPS
ncbi:MAG: (4Fe-4S)-binding protein [Gammaproteobacteria bacterium]|nr:(4Fe-4S)-binding protein [Gammaproteobacteria bacterium]NIR82400.1 (4Fe-4S)-binding protein [Gammaproteobacteria bacterium]NIR91981.1 (4Fe-4S)-binding protein [Gammaproteobacteria bacterium]NIU03537.1 (4Fe-4S)-binding protein [Gammaproteobacteria bacterium]NIX84811.1 (4Fe-4S)-binding protein [Gammaproteobacteria bacterium]